MGFLLMNKVNLLTERLDEARFDTDLKTDSIKAAEKYIKHHYL